MKPRKCANFVDPLKPCYVYFVCLHQRNSFVFAFYRIQIVRYSSLTIYVANYKAQDIFLNTKFIDLYITTYYLKHRCNSKTCSSLQRFTSKLFIGRHQERQQVDTNNATEMELSIEIGVAI